MWITLGALAFGLLLAAVVAWLWVQRSASLRAGHESSDEDVPVGWARRRAQELHAAALLPPADPQVAGLAGHVRDEYKLGDATWDALAADVAQELERAGEVGVETARFIVTSALADFQWELSFLENWNGIGAEDRTGIPIRARLFRVVKSTPASPFSTPSGFHPLIHVAAALKLLTAHPAPELLETLEELLEYWFAYAESESSLRPHDARLLELLVDCYRATIPVAPPRATPGFLTELAGRDLPPSVGQPASELSLSSLAARAHPVV